MRRDQPYVDIDIENWDYANISQSDAKAMAANFISLMILGAFGYMTIAFAIVGAIVVCVINKTEKIARFHEYSQEAFRNSQVAPI